MNRSCLFALMSLIISTASFAQTAGVGIGTTQPRAQLHTTSTLRFDTLKGTGVRPVYVNDSGSLLVHNSRSATNNTKYTIPPAGGCFSVTSSITVTGMAAPVRSSDIQVRINISHAWDADLYIFLIAPSGQVLNLAYANGGSGRNYINTVFSDGAATPLSSGTAPFTGSFRPVGSTTAVGSVNGNPAYVFCRDVGTISSFAGLGATVVPNGTWSLYVMDNSTGIDGTLNSWDILFDGSGVFDNVPLEADYLVRSAAGGTLATSSIFDNGNIGIGTSSPAHKLHVSSSGATVALVEGTGAGNVAFAVKTPANHFQFTAIGSSASGYGLSIYDAGNGADRLVITTGGNIGLGTTAPTSKLSVNGSADKPGGGSWGTFSDARLKKNVTDYKAGLKEILAIRPVSFQYNRLSGYADTGKRYVGVIAQEIETVLPAAVSITNDDRRVPDKRQFDGSELTYALINAIKEQQLQLTAQAAEIAGLKAQTALLAEFATQLEELRQVIGIKQKTAGSGMARR